MTEFSKFDHLKVSVGDICAAGGAKPAGLADLVERLLVLAVDLAGPPQRSRVCFLSWK